jgi:hypothetical protein
MIVFDGGRTKHLTRDYAYGVAGDAFGTSTWDRSAFANLDKGNAPASKPWC